MRILLLLIALVMSVPMASPAQSFVNEPFTVRNYRRAPVQLRVIRTWSKISDGERWDETCAELRIVVRTTYQIDTFSYQVGPRSQRPSVFSKVFLSTAGGTVTLCVPNDRTIDEKE